ncbi:unnamed protein product [Bubo scandiacus]
MEAAAAAAPAEAPVPAETARCWLRAEGAAAPAEEQQLGPAWWLLRRAEARLGDLERRRAEEMRDVESYVGHVRNLMEERDAITTEYEKENEQLRLELTRLQLQQEAQLKEVEEMLEQEGLFEIAHSNASEQIAYLLVERTALLEKLEMADQKLNSPSYTDRLRAAQLQSCREELEREQASRAQIEQELDEATQRLLAAQEEIQRLTDELDAQRKEQNKIQPASWSALPAPESREESGDWWRESDRTELQKAMEHNSRLDKEILTLRARVQTLDLERKAFLDLSLSDERFQQQEEKMQQLRQNLRRVQNLCSSAERELRYEREKNVDLQKQNLLLQQECTKVKAELKQTQAKLSDTTETCSCLSAQWEKSQQKVKELEQELLKCSQADKLQSSLQEKLAQEKSKVCEAQKKISKLQQKLKDSQHQLLLAEAHVSDKKLLEEELKEARENEARVQQELHEELLKRKLLEQQVEELQQQLRQSRETEASLAKMHVELQAKTLHVLEDEKKTDSSEKEYQKLSEQLSLLKEENKALYEEGVRLLNQKDLCVRKYNEMQLRHKDKIRRAKETFIHEVKQRDSRIKQLENELSESKLQVEKGKVLIAQITAENEKLLQERRRLLQKITDQEETPWSNRATIATLQSRAKIVDEESVRLHESKLQLPGHVPTSPRTPRSIRAPTAEGLRSVNFSERQLQSKVLPSARSSFPPREPPDSLSPPKAVQDAKPAGEAESQDSSSCLSPSQPSEIGYLNVASPGDTTASQLQEESQSVSSENF